MVSHIGGKFLYQMAVEFNLTTFFKLVFYIFFLDADFVTSLHHIDNFIYFFFRETAVETRKVNPSISLL